MRSLQLTVLLASVAVPSLGHRYEIGNVEVAVGKSGGMISEEADYDSEALDQVALIKQLTDYNEVLQTQLRSLQSDLQEKNKEIRQRMAVLESDADDEVEEDVGVDDKCGPKNCKACNKGKSSQERCKATDACQWMPGRAWGGTCIDPPQCEPCGKCSTSSNKRVAFFKKQCEGWKGDGCEWKPGHAWGGDCIPKKQCKPCNKCSTNSNSRKEFFSAKCKATFMCEWTPGKVVGGNCKMQSVQERLEHQNNQIEELQRQFGELRGD